jgi:hypothetical protein
LKGTSIGNPADEQEYTIPEDKIPAELRFKQITDVDVMLSTIRALEDYMMDTKRIAEQNRKDVEDISRYEKRLKKAMTATLVLLIGSLGVTFLTVMLIMGII